MVTIVSSISVCIAHMVIRVQEMINKKREERQREEQEKELKREKERIQLGREMAKLKNFKVCEGKSIPVQATVVLFDFFDRILVFINSHKK